LEFTTFASFGAFYGKFQKILTSSIRIGIILIYRVIPGIIVENKRISSSRHSQPVPFPRKWH